MADDGLDWTLNLDAKTDGASAMLASLERLDATLKRLDGKLGDTTKATGDAGEAAKKHGRHVEETGGIIKRMTSSALEPFAHKLKEIAEFEFIREGTEKLLELPGELIDKVRELGEEMLMTAAKWERTESSFKLLMGTEGAAETIEWIEQIGRHTEFSQGRLKLLAQDLAKVGFQGDALRRANAAALDIAAFSSNPEEGLSGAQTALDRIKRTGRVDNRTLAGLGIGEKDLFAELTARTGKSRKALKKEMEEGKIDAEESLEALYTVITKRTGRDLGGAGADMEKNLLSRLTHIKEIPDLLFEGVRKAEGFQKISDFLGTVADSLAPDSPFGVKAQEALDGIVNMIGDKLEGVDVAGVFEKGLTVLEQMPFAIEAIVEVVKELGTFLSPLVTGFEAVADAVDKVIGLTKSKDQDKLEFRMEHPEAFEKSRRLQQELETKQMLDKYDPSGASYNLYKAGQDNADGLSKGMKGGAGKVRDAGGELGGAAEGGVRDKLQTHSPSKVFEDIGLDTAEGFASGVELGADRVSLALERLIPSVAASGGGGGARTTTIAPQITVYVDSAGHDAQGLGDMIASKAAAAAVTAFQSAVDNMAIQSGAS